MDRTIKRRRFLEMVGAGTAAAALPGCLSGKQTAARPNILWISCEDISPDLGCYGSREVRTPNIDHLATQGVRYSNAFTVAGVCAPSRSGIITGMYPTTIGSMHMRTKNKLLQIEYECVPPPEVNAALPAEPA